jgi:UDP-3-O-[3-hydroxymyristoyl] glucosamine N-acyltransferase
MLETLQELAARIGGRVDGDDSVEISGFTTVDDARPGALTFATTDAYFSAALAGPAAAILVDAAVARADAGKPLIVVENVRLALSRALVLLAPEAPRGPFRHPSAVIESDAGIAADVYVGAGAYVGNAVTIGAGSFVGGGAYIGDRVTIGAAARIHPHATLLSGCAVGDRVVLHSGSVVGSDGFGWAFVDGRAERIPQIGNVVLEDDVEIGANSCIDRAQIGSTRIGAGTKIDNLVQVGHNCRIGKHCVIAALSGLAGSTVIGDYVKVAGQVGFRGHITVGSGVTIAGQSGVWGNVEDGATISGNPAKDHHEELRRQVMIRKLPKLFDRVEALERSRLRQTE